MYILKLHLLLTIYTLLFCLLLSLSSFNNARVIKKQILLTDLQFNLSSFPFLYIHFNINRSLPD